MEGLTNNNLKIYSKQDKIYTLSHKLSLINESCLNELETLGNKSAEVLIIVNHIIPDINSEENVLLNKILEAVGLSSTNTFVISKPNLSINLLWRYLSVNKCIIFGINTKELGLHINIESYQPTIFNDKVLLFSDGIEELKKHPEKKKLLWKALQNIFK